MDYEKMLERLQELRQEITSEARFAYTELYQRLSDCNGYVNADKRYAIADYAFWKLDAIGNKLESICNDGTVTPLGRLPYDDKTNALLFVGNILCDPKVRENAILRDYLETLYFEMYTQLADDISDAAIAKCSIDVVLRVIQRRDGRKVVAELRKGPNNELLGN